MTRKASLTTLLFFICNVVSAQWVQSNGPYGGSITAMAGTGNLVFASSFYGGIFRSTNNGANWTEVSYGIPSERISDIVISGTNIFAGTKMDGVYMSSDSGTTWNAVNNGLQWATDIASLALSGNDLFAGTGSGVYRSVNNGTSWIKFSNGLPSLFPNIVEIKSSGSNIFAVIQGYGIYKSTNNGVLWAPVNSGIIDSGDINYIAIDGNRIVCSGTFLSGIYLSNDLGVSWVHKNVPAIVPDVDAVWIEGTEIICSSNSGNIIKSVDTGNTWSLITAGLDNKTVDNYLKTGTSLFVGTLNGGIYRSLDGGLTWVQTNNGLIASLIMSMAVLDSVIFVGTYNDGIFASNDVGNSWTHLTSGVVNEPVLSMATKDSFLYVGTGNFLLRSPDYGTTWDTLANGLITAGLSSICFEGQNILVGGNYDGISKSTNNGANWTQIFNGIVGGNSCFIRQVYNHANILFSGTSEGILRSLDNGNSWQQTNNGIPIQNNEIWNFETIATTIFAASGLMGVFKSIDQGGTWIASNNGLTNFEMKDLKVVDNILFASCFKTMNQEVVFMSSDYGSTWTDISSGLNIWNVPNSYSINVLENLGGIMLAGSYGHGVYKNQSLVTNTSDKKFDKLDISFFPNPSNSGLFFVQSSEDISELIVYNTNGNSVLKKSVNGRFANLELNDQPPGVYAVHVFEKGKRTGIEIILIQ